MAHLGLHLIARDEEAKLPALLASIEGVFDEVVLCDTGSVDKTVKVFREWAQHDGQLNTRCTVIGFAWCDDFAAARNASLRALTDKCDWVAWADCDDTLQNAAHLRELAEQAPPQVAGFVFPYDYAHDESGNVICRLERERLVRRSALRGWQLPIHEVMQVEGQLARSDAVVWVHDRDPEKQNPERNFTILKADFERSEVAGEPANPRTLVYLGTESLALGRPQDALHWLRAYLDVGTWDEEICQAWHKISIAYRALHDQSPEKDELLRDAEDAALHAVAARPDWADGYIDLAEIAIRRDAPEKALRFIEKARACGTPQTLLIINPADYGFQLDVMESVAQAKLGQFEDAFQTTAKALQFAPQRQDIQAQAFGLGEEVKKRETIKHVLALYELLVRHDENAKAYELLQNVPYYVWDDPQIAHARSNQRENILHAFEPDTYVEFYENNPGEAPFELQQVPIPDAHERFLRVGFMRRDLEQWQEDTRTDKLRGLDLGANDGWVAANLSLIGCEVDGIEMNPEPAGRAAERKDDYPDMGTIVAGDIFNAPELFEPGAYDFAYCFEVIEHVPDPQLLLDVMQRMVRPGGRCYVSTPDGAYERGRVDGWANVELKGHLRAIRNEEFAGWLCERGVIEGFEVCADRTQVACWSPNPREGKVVFYAGNLFTEALPEKILSEGMGGSETALCKMAEQFARKGYDVRVYAGAGGGLRGDRVTVQGEDQLRGQVLYSPASAWDPGEDCALFVASRIPEAFDRRIKAPRRVLWLHDADYADRLTELRAKRCTDILVLSEFQRELLTEKYPFIADKVHVSRNGIEPLLFADVKPHSEREPLVVYTSSPDRGLDVLLECWPDIRRRVPDAKLIHAYADVYKTMAAANPALGEFHRRVEGLQSKCEGVEALPALNQRAIAELFSRAAVWAYPSRHSMGKQWFPEISCITAMEAQAGGAYPVVAEYGALSETIESGDHIPTGEDLDAFKAEFTDAIVWALENPQHRDHVALKNRTHALTLGWEGVCDDWEERFLAPAAEAVAA